VEAVLVVVVVVVVVVEAELGLEVEGVLVVVDGGPPHSGVCRGEEEELWALVQRDPSCPELTAENH
jgi:hypothetical protein